MTTREIILDGGLPWGFRMHGGADVQQPLRISRVNPGSKAAVRGIREGDLITSINGQNTRQLTNSEAHLLLKNSGDTLKLGLNEDGIGSPKRRQYKTIQETHEETIKSSSITTYSVKSSKTVESSAANNQKQNGRQLTKPETLIASQASTLSSNCSSNTSTPVDQDKDGGITSDRSSYTNLSSPNSYLTEEGTDKLPVEQQPGQVDNGMPDKNNSRSKRRRAKRKAAATAARNIKEITTTTTGTIIEAEEVNIDYRVDFPEAVKVEKTKVVNKETNKLVKSKSDDILNETLKIQEVHSDQDASIDGNQENQAIISEAESEWEEASDLPVSSEAEA